MKISFVNKNCEPQIFKQDIITIGREEDNDLQLLSDGISRHHGKLYNDGSNWYIEDLGSTNGIKLNNQKINEPQIISENDIIDFHQEKLQISDISFDSNKDDEPVASTVTFVSTETAKISVSDVIQPAASDNMITFDPVVIAPVEEKNSTISSFEVKKTEEPVNSSEEFDQFAAFLQQNPSTLFASESTSTQVSEKSNTKHSRFSNKLFYIVLVCAVIVIFSFTYNILSKSSTSNSNKKNKTVASESSETDYPIYFTYKKESITRDNVHYSSISIEDGKITIEVHDLKQSKKFGPITQPIPAEVLSDFKKSVMQSNFLTQPKIAPGNEDSEERIVHDMEIAYGKGHNRIVLNNSEIPTTFKDVDDALELLLDNFPFKKHIKLTPEELKEVAQNIYHSASDKLKNYESDYANLNEAIRDFKLVIDYLQGFSPTPEIRDEAEKQLKQAEKLRDKIIKDYNSVYQHSINRDDAVEARKACVILMKLYEQNSNEYMKQKDRIIKLDTYIKQINKK